MPTETVLFLCTGNSARSQMAEGLLRAKAGDRFDVRSAGTEPAAGLHPLAVRAMAEIGIEISRQRPKTVAEALAGTDGHHLIVVCDGASRACPTGFHGGITRSFWPIEDPAREASLERFREARDRLSALIEAWMDERMRAP
ncbi:MAG TPA: arsenate reductase ArsC [Candidatus Polarisedimenticolaceae bacterium]|nr:arsenate reductase ArsC [Candidatus Polarisedimenticolaceae bacterium]